MNLYVSINVEIKRQIEAAAASYSTSGTAFIKVIYKVYNIVSAWVVVLFLGL